MQEILIHYGELSLKGKNRKDFVRRLARNLKHLPGVQSIDQQYGRMLLSVKDIDKAWLQRLALMPGIRNFSPMYRAEPTLECMQEVAKKAVLDHYGEALAGRPFRVSARRANKRFPMSSPEICYEVGGFLKNQLQLKVNLRHPEIHVRIELTEEHAYISTQRHEGIGGLPVGTAGHGVVLFSGGIDSPVAAYTMMKRGMEVRLLHCYNSSINRDFSKIHDLAKQLSLYQGRVVLYKVDLEAYQRYAIAEVPDTYRMILYKRQMIREAEAIANAYGGQALVTGDSLGQVASQTLANIQAIYSASALPLLSPLIGYDKEEIIALARRIGTYELSIEEYCDICSFLIAKHPETAAKAERVQQYESLLPIDELQSVVNEEIFIGGRQWRAKTVQTKPKDNPHV